MVEILYSKKNKKIIVIDANVFLQKRKSRDLIEWRCQNRPCLAIATTPLEFDSLTIPNLKKSHSDFCCGNLDAIEIIRVDNMIKSQAINSNDSPQWILELSLRGQDASIVVNSGSSSAIKKRIWRARSNKYNPVPTNISNIDLSENQKFTILGENFYQYGPGLYDYMDDNIMIFFDQLSINNLCDNHIWAVDGTFKTSPNMFYQLFTISYIRSDHFFPCIYVLLNNKTKTTYDRMWEIILLKFPNLKPNSILIDFEKASIKSINENFPDINIKGVFSI